MEEVHILYFRTEEVPFDRSWESKPFIFGIIKIQKKPKKSTELSNAHDLADSEDAWITKLH